MLFLWHEISLKTRWMPHNQYMPWRRVQLSIVFLTQLPKLASQTSGPLVGEVKAVRKEVATCQFQICRPADLRSYWLTLRGKAPPIGWAVRCSCCQKRFMNIFYIFLSDKWSQFSSANLLWIWAQSDMSSVDWQKHMHFRQLMQLKSPKNAKLHMAQHSTNHDHICVLNNSTYSWQIQLCWEPGLRQVGWKESDCRKPHSWTCNGSYLFQYLSGICQ